MENRTTPGNLLRAALAGEKPLQVVGTINAYTALLAEQAGFRALYLSRAGVANASFGLPDLGMTNLGDVLEDVRRITYASRLPLLVDATFTTPWLMKPFELGADLARTVVKRGRVVWPSSG